MKSPLIHVGDEALVNNVIDKVVKTTFGNVLHVGSDSTIDDNIDRFQRLHILVLPTVGTQLSTLIDVATKNHQ